MSEAIEPPTVRCPKCGSTQVQGGQRGFGAGKAIGGGLLLGPVGLAAGFLGSRRPRVSCLNCGASWEPRARSRGDYSGCLTTLVVVVVGYIILRIVGAIAQCH